MPTIKVTNLAGELSSVEVDAGQTLMEALRDNDYDDIEAICGGMCSCASCHVYVEGEWFDKLGARNDDEELLVSSSDSFKVISRLSCQIKVTDDMDGLQVTIAEQE